MTSRQSFNISYQSIIIKHIARALGSGASGYFFVQNHVFLSLVARTQNINMSGWCLHGPLWFVLQGVHNNVSHNGIPCDYMFRCLYVGHGDNATAELPRAESMQRVSMWLSLHTKQNKTSRFSFVVFIYGLRLYVSATPRYAYQVFCRVRTTFFVVQNNSVTSFP